MSSLSLSPDGTATATAAAFVATPTPGDLTITPRDRRFGREAKQRRWWMNGDPIATAFYNALSVTFPKGEAMFIEAVKAHREGVPPKLAEEIRAFTMQEIMHTREHVAFNRKVEEAGYDLSELNADVDHIMALIHSRPPMVNLLATIVLEHYTAILAADFLSNPAMLEGADKDWGDLWRWHAIEEIEHKGVAYDTWLYATRDWSAWKRWRAKAVMMLIVTSKFWPKRIKGMKALLKQDGLTGWRVTARIWWFMLGNPGVMRKLAGPWLSWFRPSFHPWEHDDRALIGRHDSDFADARMPVAAE